MNLGGLLAVAVAGTVAGPAPAPQAVSSLSDAESAVVEVVSLPPRTSGARTRHGSAFYVSGEGHLLTCFHVLDRMPRENAPRLRLADGRERRFEVLDVDRATDLALLLSDPPERFMVLAEALLPDVGQRALFGDAPFRRCTVVGIATRRTVRNVKVDRFADPGDSGGPLLDEPTLAVIGVMRANLESATGGLTGADRRGNGVAVPLMYVKPFLRRNLNLPPSGRVSGEDKQEAEVCARHCWPGWPPFWSPPSPPTPTTGRASTR